MSLFGKSKHPYYSSVEWKYLTAIAKKRTRGHCALCTKAADLVHHLEYARWMKEDLRDLMPVCFDHNDRVHDPTDNGRLNDILYRLNWHIGDDWNNNAALLKSFPTKDGQMSIVYYDIFLSKNASEELWDPMILTGQAGTQAERDLLRLQLQEDILRAEDGLVSRHPVLVKATEDYIFWLRFALRELDWYEMIDAGKLVYLWPPSEDGGFRPMQWNP